MTRKSVEDLPDTPLPDLKMTRGRFNNGNVVSLLKEFYPLEQIAVMRDHQVDQRMMFGINAYYMALVKGHRYTDAAGVVALPAMPPSRPLEALVIPILAETKDASGEADPSNQIFYSPDVLKGKILHKYDEIVLGYTALACSAHCRYCYRLDIFNGTTGKGLVKADDLKQYVIDYNDKLSREKKSSPENPGYPIKEVLLSGGDPMVLSNKNLFKYMAAAAEAGVNIIRIGTKEMAFRPQRFDENLNTMLEFFHSRFPDTHVNFVTHFTHPDEFIERNADNSYVRNEKNHYKWLAPVLAAVRHVSHLGFTSIENQTPIIARVNDNAESLRLLQEELRRNGIRSKYLFQCRNIEGHSGFSVPVETAWALHNEAQKGLSDAARSRFAMSTEFGKMEVVSVLDRSIDDFPSELKFKNVFKDGLIVMKIHRSPHSAKDQGDLVIAKRNPSALWFSDYEDRILYDGRCKPLLRQSDSCTGHECAEAATVEREE